MNSEKKIIVLVGSSGSGKTSLSKYLESEGIPRVVTCTTRRIKEGEVEGKDYYFFKSREDLLKEDLLEYQEYSGNLYGTRKEDFNKFVENNRCINIVLKAKGAYELWKKYPFSVVIVKVTDFYEALEENMRKRGDAEEDIKIRLENDKDYLNILPSTVIGLSLEGNDLEKKKENLKNFLVERSIL